jgi:hypothetical protein
MVTTAGWTKHCEADPPLRELNLTSCFTAPIRREEIFTQLSSGIRVEATILLVPETRNERRPCLLRL